MVAGLGFVMMLARNKTRSAEQVLGDAFRAEAVKIFLSFGLLLLVFLLYRDVVAAALIGAFCVTILLFGMAFFVQVAEEPKKIAK